MTCLSRALWPDHRKMKTVLCPWFCGVFRASVICFVLSLFILRYGNSQQSPVKSVPAKPPKIASADWQIALQSKLLQVSAPGQSWVSNPLPDVDWRWNDVYELDAKLYRSKKLLLAQFPVVNDTNTSTIIPLRQIALERRHLMTNVLIPETAPWIELLESSADPVGLRYRPPGTPEPKAGQVETGKPVGISISPKGWMPKSLTSAQTFLPTYEIGEGNRFYNTQTGAFLPTPPRSSWQDINGFGIVDSDIRRIGSNIVWAGERHYGEVDQPQRELFWLVFDPATKKWQSHTRRVEFNILKSLLPAPLNQIEPDSGETVVKLKAWKNNSLIVRSSGEVTLKGVQLRVTALVYHSFVGPPRLLTWCVRHIDWYQRPQLEKPSDVEKYLEKPHPNPDYLWYPGATGKVVGESAVSRDTNDFVFDTDITNNAIIYLFNGKIYVLDMPI